MIQRVEAVEANLMAMVRMFDDLQRTVNELTHVCKVQDATILALNERLEAMEVELCKKTTKQSSSEL